MVFKRRTPLGVWDRLKEFVWPKRGWGRSISYILHRVRRLPDPPHRVARGVAAGIFVCFTPFYGFHFVLAGILAWLMRGNILAALMATFFGNPLTYVPIGIVALKTGYWLLGTEFDETKHRSFGGKFVDAGADLKANFFAMFTDQTADWNGLTVFYHQVFFPYLIGGILPGVIAGSIAYYFSLPLIRAYKKRRMSVIKKKFEAIKAKAASSVDLRQKAD